MADAYDATWESLDRHEVPQWFADAKLGVFVHWYPNAVPGYGFGWYAKHMHEPDHPVGEYHQKHYGIPTPSEQTRDDDTAGDDSRDHDVGSDGDTEADPDTNPPPVFEYKDFVRETQKARDLDAEENFTAENWDPSEWIDLFEAAGARYVVATAEHHDGFPMWDADYTPWTAVQMGPERDVIGDLAAATRERGLRFAGSHHRLYNYYDPRYTGTFGHPEFRDPNGEGRPADAEGPTDAFVDELQGTIRAMFDHHRPDILWLDGDWAASAETYRTRELLAEYYNRAEDWDKEVVANDRLGRVRWNDDGETHGDFYTPEYTKFDAVVETKWEATRALGNSWTYDRTETDDDLMSVTALVRNFVDIVSKNGNMLINVGPRADGTIPEIQADRLRRLGEWLETNGEAIYGSRYWVVPEDETGDVAVRYTARDEYVYAVLFGWPDGTASLSIPEYVTPSVPVGVDLLGGPDDLDCEVDGDELCIDLPESPPGGDHAWTVRVQVVESGADAFVAADPPPEDGVVRSTAALRAMVDDDYEEETWAVEE